MYELEILDIYIYNLLSMLKKQNYLLINYGEKLRNNCKQIVFIYQLIKICIMELKINRLIITLKYIL